MRVCLLLCLFVLLSCSKQAQPPLKIQIGQTLPTLVLKDVDGKPVNFSPATGKLLIVNLWATWCGACRHELPSLDRLQQKLGLEKATVIGISVDLDNHVLKEFLIDRSVDFISYWDSDQHIGNDVIGVRVYPSTLFVGPNGVVTDIVEGWREWDSPAQITKIRQMMDNFAKVKPRPAR